MARSPLRRTVSGWLFSFGVGVAVEFLPFPVVILVLDGFDIVALVFLGVFVAWIAAPALAPTRLGDAVLSFGFCSRSRVPLAEIADVSVERLPVGLRSAPAEVIVLQRRWGPPTPLLSSVYLGKRRRGEWLSEIRAAVAATPPAADFAHGEDARPVKRLDERTAAQRWWRPGDQPRPRDEDL